jgi:hypothetical protein
MNTGPKSYGDGGECRKRREGSWSRTPDPQSLPKPRIADEVEGRATADRSRVPEVEGVERVVRTGLEPSGDRDHAQQQPQVGMTERLDRHPAPKLWRCGAQRLLGQGVVAAEVGPPQAGRQGQPEYRDSRD